jgi:predicted ATPase
MRMKFTPKRRSKFLECLAKWGNVTRAATAIGMTRASMYQHREADEEFRRAWDDAVEESKDVIDQEIFRRGIDAGASQVAERSFLHAIDMARAQQAKSWELRAATSLARLWGEQGRRTEAQELLAPVYGWFSEGFDTADLKEAKELLDQLT